MGKRAASCLLLLSACQLSACKENPSPAPHTPIASASTAVPVASTAEVRPPAPLPGPHAVARVPTELLRELKALAVEQPEIRKLLEGCAVSLDTITRVDVAMAPPNRLRAELRGELKEAALRCVLDAVVAKGQLEVVTVDGGLRLGTKEGVGAAGDALLVALEGRPEDAAFVAVTLGQAPPWKLEAIVTDDDVEVTLASSAEALASLRAWWVAAKKEKTPAVPQIAEIDLALKNGKLSLEVGGDTWDDLDKSVALAMALRAHVVESWKVPSGSMMPSLIIGDHFFVDKTGPKAKRGDVIVFRYPENRAQSFVKRVIARDGDRLEVLDGRPVVNGMLLPHCPVGQLTMPGTERPLEIYVEYHADRAYLTGYDAPPTTSTCSTSADCSGGTTCLAGFCGLRQGPFVSAKGESWVMGDNRNNSHDSRTWHGGRGGGVPQADIVGRASLLYWNMSSVERSLRRIDELRLPIQDAKAEAQLKKCLADRPPLTETTPPKR